MRAIFVDGEPHFQNVIEKALDEIVLAKSLGRELDSILLSGHESFELLKLVEWMDAVNIDSPMDDLNKFNRITDHFKVITITDHEGFKSVRYSVDGVELRLHLDVIHAYEEGLLDGFLDLSHVKYNDLIFNVKNDVPKNIRTALLAWVAQGFVFDVCRACKGYGECPDAEVAEHRPFTIEEE